VDRHVEVRKESQLTIVQDVQDVSAEGTQEPQVSAVKTRGSRRRRLKLDEEQEIARLYADTSTSTSLILARFGIGESSLYRIVQRLGLPRRGRTASSKAASTQAARVSDTRTTGSSRSGGQRASQPRSRAATSAGQRSVRTTARLPRRGASVRTAVTEPRTPPTGSAGAQGGGVRKRFRILYQGERVFEAQNIQDALRQAESLGATDITGVAQEDR
jgi:hypothetical protein